MTPVMSETEARGKWCPFARCWIEPYKDAEPVAVNRARNGSPCQGSLCISSACMAWRQARKDSTGQEYGFCGLAGGAP